MNTPTSGILFFSFDDENNETLELEVDDIEIGLDDELEDEDSNEDEYEDEEDDYLSGGGVDPWEYDDRDDF